MPEEGIKKPAPKKRRTISKARLYKEVVNQAYEYDMSLSAILSEFIDQLGEDVIRDATK